MDITQNASGTGQFQVVGNKLLDPNGATSFTFSSVDWARLSGSYPVMVDEVGNYDDGAPNPSGSAIWNQQFLTFLAKWVKNQNGVGCIAFTWYCSDGNTLTDGNNNLNQWGQSYRTYFLTPPVSYSP